MPITLWFSLFEIKLVLCERRGGRGGGGLFILGYLNYTTMRWCECWVRLWIQRDLDWCYVYRTLRVLLKYFEGEKTVESLPEEKGNGQNAESYLDGVCDLCEVNQTAPTRSAGELSRSLSFSHHRSVGYRGRQCGFNKKHQSTKARGVSPEPRCRKLGGDGGTSGLERDGYRLKVFERL